MKIVGSKENAFMHSYQLLFMSRQAKSIFNIKSSSKKDTCIYIYDVHV